MSGTVNDFARKHTETIVVVSMKVSFVLLTGCLVIAATLLAGWIGAVVAVFLALAVYGKIRKYLVGPPSATEYANLWAIYTSRAWVKPTGVHDKPETISQRTKYYAKIINSVDQIAEKRRAEVSGEQLKDVDAWVSEIAEFVRSNRKYDWILSENVTEERIKED